jgi:hypothetical protein
LSGVVLFPEATLPLRVIQPNFIAAVERALTQVDAPYTIGVVGELLMTAFHLLYLCLGFLALVLSESFDVGLKLF